MSLALGEHIGPYEIIARLGSGGTATVYKAYHAALDRHVALKILHPVFKDQPDFLARFEREAKIVGKLEHPHIVPVHDFNLYNEQPYLVMRFIEGETLEARMQAGQLSVSQALNIIRPVCQALVYAHQQGVLHRDIKPSNILLTYDGVPFLTDFGLARLLQAGESGLSRDMMMGTPRYISPEQAQGKSDLDARTDIYSLGVVFFEMLTGRAPFDADTPYALIYSHIFNPPPPPRSLNPNLPETFEIVLLKALAKKPEARYGSAADMLFALEQAANGCSPAELALASARAPTALTNEPSRPVASTSEHSRAVSVDEALEMTKRGLASLADALSTTILRELPATTLPPAGTGLASESAAPSGTSAPKKQIDWKNIVRSTLMPGAKKAIASLKQGLDVAQAQAYKAIESSKDTLEGQFVMGAIYMQQGEYTLAKEYLERVVNSPQLPEWVTPQARRMLDILNEHYASSGKGATLLIDRGASAHEESMPADQASPATAQTMLSSQSAPAAGESPDSDRNENITSIAV